METLWALWNYIRGLIVTARSRKNTTEVLGEILETLETIADSCYPSRGRLRAHRGKFTNTRRAQEADLVHSPLDE